MRTHEATTSKLLSGAATPERKAVADPPLAEVAPRGHFGSKTTTASQYILENVVEGTPSVSPAKIAKALNEVAATNVAQA